MTQDFHFKENKSETAFLAVEEMLNHFAQVPYVLWSLSLEIPLFLGVNLLSTFPPPSITPCATPEIFPFVFGSNQN